MGPAPQEPRNDASGLRKTGGVVWGMFVGGFGQELQHRGHPEDNSGDSTNTYRVAEVQSLSYQNLRGTTATSSHSGAAKDTALLLVSTNVFPDSDFLAGQTSFVFIHRKSPSPQNR